MKQPRFRCADRDPEYLSSLIHGAFLQLIKFDDVSKTRTQLCDGFSQGGLVLCFRANLFWIRRKIPEFMFEIGIERFGSVFYRNLPGWTILPHLHQGRINHDGGQTGWE